MKLGTNDIGSVYLGTNAVQKVYLGTNEVWSAFDPDYQAILDYATTQGYTLPSAGQQALQNQLVVDLKAAGIWSKLDTFAVFATDGNSDFALIDWKRLSQYTAVNSPTFTTNEGFAGDNVSAYIDSNYNPSTSGVNYTLDNASFGYYMKTISPSPSTTEGIFGARGPAIASWIRFTTQRLYINSAFATMSIFTSTSNQLAIANRVNATTVNIYDNGILSETLSSSRSTVVNESFKALVSPSSTPDYTLSEVSMVFAGSNLSSEASDFNTAWNNYFTAL
jgi:hypothetical protein